MYRMLYNNMYTVVAPVTSQKHKNESTNRMRRRRTGQRIALSRTGILDPLGRSRRLGPQVLTVGRRMVAAHHGRHASSAQVPGQQVWHAFLVRGVWQKLVSYNYNKNNW